MPRSSDDTKARLLSAATSEFAGHGIAGARVDRIAAAASANKNLIYVYFGSKDRLFEAVHDAAVAELLEAAPFDPDDLPGYAGALFDFYREHPHLIRLTRWRALEQPGAGPLPLSREATRAKLESLARAQAEGRVDAGLPAGVLLTLVLTLAAAWSDGSPEGAAPDDPEQAGIRRDAVVAAVGRLTRRDPASPATAVGSQNAATARRAMSTEA